MIGLICKETHAVLKRYFNTQSVKNSDFTVGLQAISETCSAPRYTAEGDRAELARTITALH